MPIKKITPELYKEVAEEEEAARRARNEDIKQLRAADPVYWTMERLAKKWNISKQAVQYILEH